MLRKAASVRYLSNSVGTLFTITNLFIVTYLLDIYQFALWGVANSLVYIFSSVGQLTYVQYIEKYFPTYSGDKMNFFLYKFLKTISLLIFIWLSVLYLLKYVGYFDKYNADNMHILFIIIAFLTFVESAIELVSKYLLALKKTENYDLNELVLFKIVRVVIFYLLLSNGYSVYYLLLTNLFLRAFLLLRVLNHDSSGIKHIITSIFYSDIRKENFENFSYTIVAFSIKTLQVTFLNVIFLLLTVFSDNETIANYSLGILIINNLRPIFSSLSGLLTPIISKNIEKRKNNDSLFNLVNYINRISISIVVIISMYIIDYRFLINNFLQSFDDSVYSIILISICASSVTSLYIPVFLKTLFENNEKKLLKIILFNYIFSLASYSILEYFYTINIIYVYLFFEILNFSIFYILFQNKKNTFFNSYSFYSVGAYLVFYITTSSLNLFFLLVCLLLIFIDLYKFKNKFSNFVNAKDIDYETE
ncbi:hypothetical protein N9309_02560 [Acidimicrobiia bacterium]|nr:hypothetical protein [Acidimicrobiia bacterium]